MPQEISIAVVDDTLSVLDVTALMLEDAGFHPLTYCNAALFIDSLQNNQPSLVLLDLMMPLMNGIECLERLSTLGVSFPILMFSSIDDDHYRARALQLGAKGYVTKDELLSRTKEIINKYI
jgi:DNA-binding response OmpR family regulator